LRFTRVILQTSILSEIRKFYGETLGFPVIQSEGQRVTVQIGWSQLVFCSSQEVGGSYHLAFNISEGEIETAENWLQSRSRLIKPRGAQTPIVEFPNWKARSIYFFDPEKNILEFISRAGVTCRGAKSETGILVQGISEFGVVVPKIAPVVDEMQSGYEIPHFARQPPLDNFGAVGDDEGLFILTTPDRVWYPTDIPCKYTKASVFFLNHNGESFGLLTG
jgi:extradiol dioxygenase family protein